MHGQRVVVVGGGSGIGFEVVRQAVARGAQATAAGRSPDRLAAAAARAPGLGTFVADVTDPASLEALFASLGPVDHVYCSAGAFAGGTAAGGDAEAQRRALEPRVWGVANLVRAAAGRIRPGGSLTLTGGLSSDRPTAGAWITAVGTAAAEQSARVLALELAPIRVNAVSPGWTDTAMWDAVLGEGKAEAFAAVAARLPAGRIASAADVADAVLFLMNNRAVTGEVLHVDGGHRLV
jgi:NAD(P)-dependent dehydrogenase (short-subunit alcohol dehydrogenase family)